MSRLAALAPVRRLRRELLDPLMRSAYSLMLNSVATATLGLAFWALAAHVRSTSQVGEDSALIASMMTLSSIFQLNLANTISRFLPQAGPRSRRWILFAYAIAAIATALGAVAFVAIVPTWAGSLRFVRDDALLAALFVGASTLWSIFGLQDAVLTALRRAPWVPLENAAFGMLKVAFLAALATLAFGHAVFAAWTLPMAVLLVPVNYLIFRRFIPAHVRRHPEGKPLAEVLPSGRVRRFLVADYLGSVAQQASLALPVLLVIGLLGSSANAYFYVPYMLVTAFDTLFFNASVSLVVEGAFESGTTAELTTRLLSRVGMLVLPGVLVMVAAAPLLLLPFGSSYAAHGASVLRLLALASVFQITISVFAAVSRIRGRGGAILATYSGVVALLVPLTLVLCPALGIEGAALAWLAANGLVAASVAPSLSRLLRAGASPAARRPSRLAGRARGWIADRRGEEPRPGEGVPWSALSRLGMLTSVAAIAASLPGAPTGIRFGVLLVFVCTAPGAALLGALEPATARMPAVAVLASGLALGALAAQLLLWLGAWSPGVVTAASGALCLCVLVAMRGRRA